METKKLYILIEDLGDGSRTLRYSLDSNIVESWAAAHDRNELDYDAPGVDGDGFSYKILNVPTDMTYTMLGISETYILKAYTKENA